MPRFIMVWTFGDIFGAAIFMVLLFLGLLFVLALGYEKAKRWWKKAFADFLSGRRE